MHFPSLRSADGFHKFPFTQWISADQFGIQPIAFHSPIHATTWPTGGKWAFSKESIFPQMPNRTCMASVENFSAQPIAQCFCGFAQRERGNDLLGTCWYAVWIKSLLIRISFQNNPNWLLPSVNAWIPLNKLAPMMGNHFASSLQSANNTWIAFKKCWQNSTPGNYGLERKC